MSNTINAIIVDDENKAIKNLTSLLSLYPNVNIVGTANSADSARQLIETIKPQLVFLDVNMPGESGFELLEKLTERNFEVIFVTAHDEYALRALRANAIDYIQKPIDIDELKTAIEKASGIIEQKAGVPYDNAQLSSLGEMIKQLNTNQDIEKITIPHLGGFKIIELKNIMYFEGDGNYTTLHLQTMEKIVVTRQLGVFEEILPTSSFFRIHKSTIVNLNYVTGYNSSEGSVAVMKDNNTLTVSRRRLDDFLTKLSSIA
jgi:two-component system, LytTR family, response regulator